MGTTLGTGVQRHRSTLPAQVSEGPAVHEPTDGGANVLGPPTHALAEGVLALAGLGSVPLHPTPLYSILSNVVVGVLLVRLCTLGASEGIVIGTYLMLAGLARFVEEAYRGEPQTPSLGRLRLYQWLAVLSVVIGALVTTAASRAVPERGLAVGAGPLGAGRALRPHLRGGQGLDFPGSNRRFTRLAPTV